MKAKDRQYMSEVASIGCIVCLNLGYSNTPAELHHVRDGQGLGQRASNKEIIPLCHLHHRTGGHGIAFHAGKETWQAKFGTEVDLLYQVQKRLEQ